MTTPSRGGHGGFSQTAPLFLAAAVIAVVLLWPRIGAVALWTFAGLCVLAFAFGIWRQSKRG